MGCFSREVMQVREWMKGVENEKKDRRSQKIYRPLEANARQPCTVSMKSYLAMSSPLSNPLDSLSLLTLTSQCSELEDVSATSTLFV